MIPFVYIIVALVTANTCEAKSVDIHHNATHVDSMDKSSLGASVNGMPESGVYCAGSTKWLLQKVQVIAVNNVIIFYPHEKSGLHQSYPCHYESQTKDPEYPIELADGYEDFIRATDGYYNDDIIDLIKVADSTIWVPNYDFVYEPFSTKSC